MPSIPTRGEKIAELTEHLRKAQECAAMIGHLHGMQDTKMDTTLQHGWLGISELLKKINHNVALLAAGRVLQ